MTLEPDQIRRAARGDREARHHLVQAHGALVFAMCRRLCPDPDDAYQDVWAKVFSALRRFDPGRAGELRSWIATITRRHLVDRHRRSQVRGAILPPRPLEDPGPGPDLLAHRSALRRRLEAAIQILPEGQRRAVVGHDIHGTPLAVLAEDEGVALGTIKSRLHRGRATLAADLRPHLDPGAPHDAG